MEVGAHGDKPSPTENGNANANGGSGTDHHDEEENGDRKRSCSEVGSSSLPRPENGKKQRMEDGGVDASSVGSHGSTRSESAKNPNIPVVTGAAAAAAPTRKSQRRRGSNALNGESHSEDEADVPVKEIHMSRKEREEEERARKLDPSTLSVLRDALSGGPPQSHLNDDELIHFLTRVDREARQQSHLQGGSHPEESDGSVLEELVAEAEDLALGREVLHKAIASVNKKHIGEIDRRTIEWVRKASGLAKSKMENFLRENAEAGRITKGAGGRGRYTRNMARSTREERREKGLGILLSTVDELEGTLGPYPPFKPKKRKRPPAEKAPDPEPDETQKPAKAQNRKKITESKRKSDTKAAPKPPRDRVRDGGHRPARERVEKTPEATLSWDDIRPLPENDVDLFDFPACKNDSSVYARKGMRLVRRMRQGVLAWSRYEFFYSDVDRAWFARNEFVRKATRLGIRPGTLLTQREWNVVRRQIRGKPRRFSKRFVEGEYTKLQNYRVHVRMLQTNPDPSFATRLGFDFEVPKPIPVGAPISAVAQRKSGTSVSSPIQRGSVLSFSHGFYLVQLTGGIALLPDFMVARHGPTDILIPAPRTSLVGMREAVVEESGPTSPSSSWSGPGPLDHLLNAEGLLTGRCNHDVEFRAGQNRGSSNPWYMHPDATKMAENELILTALVGAEMALKRKKTILEAMESLDAVDVFNESNAASEEMNSSIQKHLNWLLDSLDEADESYKLAKEYVEHLAEMPIEENADAVVCKTEVRDIPAYFNDRLADSHAARLLLHASGASRAAVSNLLAGGGIPKEMEGILYSVGQLLLIPAVHSGEKSTALEAHVGKAVQTAVSTALVPLCQSFDSPDETADVGNFETHLYQNALKDREQALESLKEAADLLNIEFTECARKS